MTLLHPSIREHWHSQHEELQLSTVEFYDAIEKALDAKGFPRVGHSRVELSESSLFSSKRLYLKVTRNQYEFLICAAPFGRDFFFSWYLKEYMNWALVFEAIPFVGKWLMSLIMRKTFFQRDSELMFLEGVKGVVNSVLSELQREKGIRQQISPDA